MHYRTNWTAIRASPLNNLPKCTYFGGRNWNETREWHWKSGRFVFTGETETSSPPSRPVSWETKQSHRVHPRNIPEKPVFRFFRISGFQLASSLTVPLPIVRVNFARAKVTSSLLQQGPVLTIHRFKKMVEIYYLRARINPGDRSIRGHGREI